MVGFVIAPAANFCSHEYETPLAAEISGQRPFNAVRRSRAAVTEGCSMSAQRFAQYRRNTLRSASATLPLMNKPIVQIVAENLRRAYAVSGFKSYRQLGAKAGVAANTVKNLAEPDSRERGKRGEVSPRMDILDKIAGAMGYRAWQLMLENFDPADRPTRVLRKSEADFYGKVEALYRDLPPDPLNGRDGDQ